MKDVDDNIIDETQKKTAEVELNPDDDDDLKIGKVKYIIENQDTGECDFKDTDDDIRRSGNYDEDIEQQPTVENDSEDVKIVSEGNRKDQSKETKYHNHGMVHSSEKISETMVIPLSLMILLRRIKMSIEMM